MKLNNGKDIPIIGYGTWLIKDEDAINAVKHALEVGYRHIDTAQVYENEVGVGKGIKASLINREDIFITSKIDADIKDYEMAKKSIEESLKKLDVSYIDLMLIHAPTKWDDDESYRYEKENVAVYKALEEAVEEGKIISIGLSNFLEDDIENILNNCSIKPVINQIQIHIGHTPLRLMEYCKSHDIALESFSPLAHGTILDNPYILSLAKKYNVTPARLALSYTYELGCITLPKALGFSHMEENLLPPIHIDDKDMKSLKTLVLPDWDVD